MLPSAIPSRTSCSQRLAVKLVWHEHHREIAAAGGLDHRQRLEAMRARVGDPVEPIGDGLLQRHLMARAL